MGEVRGGSRRRQRERQVTQIDTRQRKESKGLLGSEPRSGNVGRQAPAAASPGLLLRIAIADRVCRPERQVDARTTGCPFLGVSWVEQEGGSRHWPALFGDGSQSSGFRNLRRRPHASESQRWSRMPTTDWPALNGCSPGVA